MNKLFLLVLLCAFSTSSLSAKFFYAQGPKDKKAIALTFDDGPGPWTISILDLLDKKGIKATFFMNGDQVEIRPKIAAEVLKRGHEIGDHTFSHMNFYPYEKKYGSEAAKGKIAEEIEKSRRMIIKKIGITPTLCRMPHGFNKPWMEELAQKFNYTFINWTFGEDWHPIPEEKMVQDYFDALHAGAILLFHDGGRNRKKTLEILTKVITEAKKRGYTFLPIGELIGTAPSARAEGAVPN